jgi:hypothetical protein
MRRRRSHSSPAADRNLIARALARAAPHGRDAVEATTNLAAGYHQMLTTARTAREEGDADAALRFRRRAASHRWGLLRIARGADPRDVHARVTGSRVFA